MGELWGRTFKKPLLYCFNWAATCANETQVGVPQRAPGLPGQCRPAMPRRAPKSLQERCHFKEKMEKSKWDHITVEQLKPVALGQKKKKVILLQLPLKSTDIPNYMYFYSMRHRHNVYTHL